MLVALSFVAGLFTAWWWVPASAGLIGQIAHYASSPNYRATLHRLPGAIPAALLSMATLTLICLGAFALGSLLAGWSAIGR